MSTFIVVRISRENHSGTGSENYSHILYSAHDFCRQQQQNVYGMSETNLKTLQYFQSKCT